MKIKVDNSSGFRKVIFLVIFFACVEASSFAAAARNWNLLTASLTCVGLIILVLLVLTLIKTKGHRGLRLLIGSVIGIYALFMIYHFIRFLTNFD